jgi:hypothetical protein
MFAKPYDAYVFFLCFIVFVALTAMFGYLLAEIVKLTVKLIRGGLLDEKIIRDYFKPKKPKWIRVTGKVCSITLCCILLCGLIFSTFLQVSENYFPDAPSLKVVASSSMQKKHKRNTYLVENNLNDQFNMFDLIVTHPVPDEFDLELYDIVVYEYDDIHVVHRIVRIEEPNSKHPDHRLFITQGDAVSSADREPVTYEQIKAIYRGERVQFIGSFVFFLRSPAGWLCVLLVLFTIIATPIVEKKILKAILERLRLLGYFNAHVEVVETNKEISVPIIEDEVIYIQRDPITFDFGDPGKASHSNGSLENHYEKTIDNCTLNIVDGLRLFVNARDSKGKACLKLGVEQMIGSCAIIIPDDVKYIVLNVAKYKNNISKLYVNEEMHSLVNSSAKGKYDRIIVDTRINKRIVLKTETNCSRIMMSSIEFHFNEDGK